MNTAIMLRCNCLGLSAVLAAGVLSPAMAAQEIAVLQGLATNRGYSGDTIVGVSEIRIVVSDWIDGDGELTVLPPLGGSGGLRLWAWQDSIVSLSVSPQGDTILWVASKAPFEGSREAVQERLGDRLRAATGDVLYRGSYWIAGGQWRFQIGSWSVWPIVGSIPMHAARPGELASIAIAQLGDARPVDIHGGSASEVTVGSDSGGQTAALGAWALILGVLGVLGGMRLGWPPTKVPEPRRAQPEPEKSEPQTAYAARASGQRTRPRSGAAYNVLCPHCNASKIEAARKIYFMYGLLLAARYGHRIEVGCGSCLRARVRCQLFKNLALGWWCIPWGLLTPLVVLSNLWALLAKPDLDFTDDVLQKVGIDPSSVRIGDDGLTGEQRALYHAASIILRAAIDADGQATSGEYAVAEAILQQLTGGAITVDSARAKLRQTAGAALDVSNLSNELRVILLEAAIEVVLADGRVAASELEFLKRVASWVSVPQSVLADALRRRTGADADSAEGTAKREGGNLGRALKVLGLAPNALWQEVRQAYRRAMLRYHPDRAGRDERKQAEFSERAKEINWAYQTCQAHYGAR